MTAVKIQVGSDETVLVRFGDGVDAPTTTVRRNAPHDVSVMRCKQNHVGHASPEELCDRLFDKINEASNLSAEVDLLKRECKQWDKESSILKAELEKAIKEECHCGDRVREHTCPDAVSKMMNSYHQDLESAKDSEEDWKQRYYMGYPAWQPMDTAPTDGSWVLACFHGGFPMLVKYDDREKNSKAGPNAYSRWAGENGGLHSVSHWMPLPKPPK